MPILNSRFLLENKQSLAEYLCSYKSIVVGVDEEFSKKVLISFFFLDPSKPLDKFSRSSLLQKECLCSSMR